MGGLAYDTSHVHVIKRKIEMIYSTQYMTPSCTGPPFCTMLNFSVGCNFCYILLDKHHLNQKQFHCKKKKKMSSISFNFMIFLKIAIFSEVAKNSMYLFGIKTWISIHAEKIVILLIHVLILGRCYISDLLTWRSR